MRDYFSATLGTRRITRVRALRLPRPTSRASPRRLHRAHDVQAFLVRRTRRHHLTLETVRPKIAATLSVYLLEQQQEERPPEAEGRRTEKLIEHLASSTPRPTPPRYSRVTCSRTRVRGSGVRLHTVVRVRAWSETSGGGASDTNANARGASSRTSSDGVSTYGLKRRRSIFPASLRSGPKDRNASSRRRRPRRAVAARVAATASGLTSVAKHGTRWTRRSRAARRR